MKKYLIFLLPILVVLYSCETKQKSFGDKEIKIFDNEIIHFVDEDFDNQSIVHLAQGRILLKKLKLPTYEKDVKVNLEVKLQSNGDRWDKSGSFFVIPKGSKINFRTLSDSVKFPKVENFDYGGVLCGENYEPVVELMRFMTPFGVGFYSEKSRRKPVYIPYYENEVIWNQDITDRISLLEDEVWVGVWVDTWTAEGYKISATMYFDETEAINFPKKKTHIKSLVNTVAYIGGQKLPDFFAYQDLKTTFTLPKNAKNVQIKYITTGHGGHSGGDEFVKKENKVLVDGEEVLSFIPWRDDCASFRRFNPTSGVWLKKDTASYLDMKLRRYNEKVIEERIASSDLSRSNWCPGSDVLPITVNLPEISPGNHELTIKVIDAQPANGDELNHWLVSAYLYWEE